MTTYYDVPADLLIASLSEKLKSYDKVSAPEWASQVKTGTHIGKDRPFRKTGGTLERHQYLGRWQ